MDLKENTQTFFNLHTDDIISLDLHPDGNLVATGEIGPKPFIFIWDSETKEVIQKWKGVILKGVATLAFSPSGDQLVAASIDDLHHIGVFDVKKGGSKVFEGGREIILDLDWLDEDSFATVGVKHFKFWKATDASRTKYKGDNGNFGAKACKILSGCGFNKGDCVVGAADGKLQIWKGNGLKQEID